MTSHHKIILSLSVAIVLLVFVSGSMLLHLQRWLLESQSSVQAKPVNTTHTSDSGIRSMVSSELRPETEADSTASNSYDVKRQTSAAKKMNAELKSAKKSLQATRNANGVSQPKMVIRTFNQPVLVIYEDEVVIEFPKKIATEQNIKRAVARVLLSPSPQLETDLLSKKSLLSKAKPYFYRKVLDHKKQPIRYPKQAYRYAKHLLQNQTEEYSDVEGDFIAVRMPLEQIGLKGPAKNYQAWVENYADEFAVAPALVYAVMETESGFNPKAVSRSNAIGLMQVKAHTAGRDVYEYIDSKKGQPSKWDLFNSEENIRMGTAYLSLLKHNYLSEVENEKIKQLLTISSYNGGLSTVLSLFGNNNDQAIERINRMTPKQVYRKLKYEHHSDETRRYIDKVLKAEAKYQKMLDEV